MESDYEDREVVWVHRPSHLIDPESYERHYRTAGGTVLPKGYYLVLWPADLTVRRFDERARFVGPFPTRADAEAARRAERHGMPWRHGMTDRRRHGVLGVGGSATDRRHGSGTAR